MLAMADTSSQPHRRSAPDRRIRDRARGTRIRANRRIARWLRQQWRARPCKVGSNSLDARAIWHRVSKVTIIVGIANAGMSVTIVSKGDLATTAIHTPLYFRLS